MVLDNVPDHPEFNKINIRIVLQAIYRVSEAIQLYDDNFGKLTTKTTLVRPTVKVLPLPDDFQIQKVNFVLFFFFPNSFAACKLSTLHM